MSEQRSFLEMKKLIGYGFNIDRDNGELKPVEDVHGDLDGELFVALREYGKNDVGWEHRREIEVYGLGDLSATEFRELKKSENTIQYKIIKSKELIPELMKEELLNWFVDKKLEDKDDIGGA